MIVRRSAQGAMCKTKGGSLEHMGTHYQNRNLGPEVRSLS